jgi:hypothetical protein
MKEELKKAIEMVVENKSEEGVLDMLNPIMPKFGFEDAKKLVEETDEGKQFINSFADSRVSKAVETAVLNFKEKSMPDILKSEVEKAKEALLREHKIKLSPEEERIKRLEEETEMIRRENKQKDLLMFKLDKISESSLPREFMDYVSGDSKEDIESNVKNLQELFSSKVSEVTKSEIDKKFKELGGTPKKSDPKGGGKISKADVDRLFETAKKTGRVEDRAAYSMAKRELLQQQNK